MAKLAEETYLDPRTVHTTEFFKRLVDMKLQRPGEILGVEAHYTTMDADGDTVVSGDPTKTIAVYAFTPTELAVHLIDWSEDEAYLLYCTLDKLVDDLGIEKAGTFYR